MFLKRRRAVWLWWAGMGLILIAVTCSLFLPRFLSFAFIATSPVFSVGLEDFDGRMRSRILWAGLAIGTLCFAFSVYGQMRHGYELGWALTLLALWVGMVLSLAAKLIDTPPIVKASLGEGHQA